MEISELRKLVSILVLIGPVTVLLEAVNKNTLLLQECPRWFLILAV